MRLLYVLKIVIITVIIYVICLLFSTFLTPNSPIVQEVNIDTDHNIYIPVGHFETDCRFQPKRCPDESCDCLSLCNTSEAQLLEISPKDKIRRVFNNIPAGRYCYVPTNRDSCHEDFATWTYDKTFKCTPKYFGVFNNSGKQIAGKYPYTHANKLIKNIENPDYNDVTTFGVDCSNIFDEYGNKLLHYTLPNNVSFCLKDYCFNNIPHNPATGYKNGVCWCDNGTEHFIFGDDTSPCVPKSNDENFIKIACYTDNTLLKDLSNYLVKCPDGKLYTQDEKTKITNTHVIKGVQYLQNQSMI